VALGVFLCGTNLSSKAQENAHKPVDISSVPMERRRSAFSAASPQEKSEAFRTRLALYLAHHSQLNETQKRILLDGISLAAPQLYEIPRESPEWKSKVGEPVSRFQTSVLSGFSRDESGAIFAGMANLDNQDEFLQKYREVVALPMAHRRGAFLAASSQDKSDLWRTHFALYIAKHPELTDAQRIIILEGMTLVAPQLFAVPFGGEEWKVKVTDTLKAFSNHILGVFSKPDAGKIFATLGDPQFPSEPKLGRSAPALLAQPARDDSQAMFVLTRFAKNDELTWVDCECNKSESFCGFSYTCGNAECSTTQYGCGYAWLSQCNGGCLERRED
jgi:hypothetical protein